MIGKHRAYALLSMLVLFNLAIPVATAMGFNQPISSQDPSVGSRSLTDLYTDGIGSWEFWSSVGAVSALLVIASRVGGIRVTFSTVIFSGVFLGTSAPVNGLLSNMESAGWINPAISGLVIGIYALAFIIGLIEVSR